MNKNIIIAILIIIIIAAGVFLIFGHSSDKTETQINFLNNNTVKNGEQVTFELKDANGNPLAGETVNITYNTNEKYSVITDNSGRGHLAINGEDAGNYDVIANYGGSDKYKACTAKVTITVTGNAADNTVEQTSNNSVADTSSHNSGKSSSGYADANGGQGLGSHPFENETPINEVPINQSDK